MKTQPDRRTYVKSKIEESLANVLKCHAATLTFVRTEDKGGEFYDYYMAEGCGLSTEYMTLVKVMGNDDSWSTITMAGPVPTTQDYREQSRAQLVKTAEFDLECQHLQFVELNELIAPMRNAYEASIGATGCNNKSTYLSKCNQTGFVAGKFELSCSSTNTSSKKP